MGRPGKQINVGRRRRFASSSVAMLSCQPCSTERSIACQLPGFVMWSLLLCWPALMLLLPVDPLAFSLC